MSTHDEIYDTISEVRDSVECVVSDLNSALTELEMMDYSDMIETYLEENLKPKELADIIVGTLIGDVDFQNVVRLIVKNVTEQYLADIV